MAGPAIGSGIGPAIGIDVGGTKIAAAVVGDDGAIIARDAIATAADAPNAIATGIVKIARELRGVAPSVCAVGIGAAGLVDSARGMIVAAPNLSYRNLAIRDLVSARLSLPAFVDNDANTAAWAEARFGAGRGRGDQIMITVGTGIGGGLILGERVYRGVHGFAAEIGHMIVLPGGPSCPCGARGCFEQLASGNAIGRIARERIEAAPDSLVLERAGDAAAITGEIVGRAARDGDVFAREIVAEAGRWLGIGIASLVNVFDPAVVIVGGGAAAGTGDLLLDPARDALREHLTLAVHRPAVEIVPAALGNDAGAVGAADLARSAR
ncbi:MAG TPA: ROK family protein [Actinomycetota bacterium]